MITKTPTLFWGLIASMWIGNLMLVVLNLPLVGMWAKLATIPYFFLFPAILMFCCVGVFSLENNNFGIFLMAGFGLFGYALKRLGAEPAPLDTGLPRWRRVSPISQPRWTLGATKHS